MRDRIARLLPRLSGTVREEAIEYLADCIARYRELRELQRFQTKDVRKLLRNISRVAAQADRAVGAVTSTVSSTTQQVARRILESHVRARGGSLPQVKTRSIDPLEWLQSLQLLLTELARAASAAAADPRLPARRGRKSNEPALWFIGEIHRLQRALTENEQAELPRDLVSGCLTLAGHRLASCQDLIARYRSQKRGSNLKIRHPR